MRPSAASGALGADQQAMLACEELARSVAERVGEGGGGVGAAVMAAPSLSGVTA